MEIRHPKPFDPKPAPNFEPEDIPKTNGGTAPEPTEQEPPGEKPEDPIGDPFGKLAAPPRGLVEETARHLREAKMLPDSEDQASIEHAVALLLGLMAAPTPVDAPDCARLYAQLPLDRVTRGELTPDGRTEMVEIGEPSPLMDEVRDLGETFGSFLTSLIESAEPGSSVEPGEIVVGGGPGTATGAVGFEIYDQIYPLAAFVKFTLAPLGGDRRPDDAPRARLDCYATVPGSIFTVFREFFTGDSEGPLEISPARTTVVHQAGQSE